MTDLKKAIEAAGIEKAERIIAEMKASPKQWSNEEIDRWFLDLTNGMMLRREPSRPGVLLWDGLINGERVTLFEQNKKNEVTWCRWLYVWRIMEVNFSNEYTEVQAKVKFLLEEHLKWKAETPPHNEWYMGTALEEHLKWKAVTPGGRQLQ